MVYEQFLGDHERFWGWRCIFCGEIVDDVILENRQWNKRGVTSTNNKSKSGLEQKPTSELLRE
jgi:hypothetical protein